MINVDKEVEDFKAQLELLVFTGADKAFWMVSDAERDEISQLSSVGFLKNAYPDLFIFASSAKTPEEVIVDMENYIEALKEKTTTLKVARENAKKMNLHLGV